MSAQIPARRLRLEVDVATPTTLLDKRQNDTRYQATPLFIRGNATDVEVGIYYAEELADVSDIATLYLEVWKGATLLLQKTLATAALNTGLTDTTWEDNSEAHAVFECSNTDMNWTAESLGSPASGAVVDLNMEITALMTDGRKSTFAIGEAKVLVPRHTVSGTPVVADPAYLTADEIAAIYQQHVAEAAAKNLKIFNPDDGENYQIAVRTIDTVPTLVLETTPV